jgi:predicted DsbA family dithiol-disulfide isomerase
VRLRRLEKELAGRIVVDWRSYLLRPTPNPGRTLEKFREYTRSWLRPAADADCGTFRVWETDEGPPSHSIPPHLVAKAAAEIGGDAFERIHERLLRAYFAENRDITAESTQRSIWNELSLPEQDFERRNDPALLDRVVTEHKEAMEYGVTGVPAARIEGREGVIVGAHPIELYRRWMERNLAAEW